MVKASHDISPSSIRSSRLNRKPRKKAESVAKPRPKTVGLSRLSDSQIREIFRRFHAESPEPKGELEYVNPYTLLIAVVLSAQATDAGVNKATRALFKVVHTPAKMVALGEDKLRDYIRTIGLYRTKAKNVIALSKRLVEEFGGKVPDDRDVLETLPGVGRKTANVVMNIAFGQPTMAVDTHVLRVANRTGLSQGTTPLAVEADLLRVIPPEYALHAHHWLILHGRYVCKARKPECWRCLINDICLYPDKTPAPTT
ncbi:endonuclease III [Hyphomicrobium sp.]|jgi:endonuclease-3|uniref:endonuclease III n=1 Tax=Hyphomicrobium sp. TaxID=82 RepID=UPI002C43632E|nr:endonuclease III [Hyphomicrobium sp.]HVZ05565.1 endonuclease III [Hyphomicrobium sp.]